MRSYRKLIEIEFLHNYYPDGKLASGDVDVLATPETKTIFSNYRIILKLLPNKIEIIQECEKDDKGIEAVIEIDSPLKFDFIIGLSNKKFFNFTNTRYLKMRKEIFFFTNNIGKKIAETGKLSVKEEVSDDDIKSIEVLNLDKSKSTSGIIGYIEINTDKFINKPIQTEKPLHYFVKFPQRQVYLQYNVNEKFNSVKNIQIIDEQKKLIFKELKQEQEQTSVKLISDKKVPLQLISKDIYKLISANGSKNYTKTLYEKLPVPSLRDLIKHQDIENEFVAVANIYI